MRDSSHQDGASSGPVIAVVVPATDRPRTLESCLRALRTGDREPDEMMVVREPAGAGPAAARNAGAAHAEAELLVFVDSDVEVHADALARIERRFAADPELTAVFGAYDDDPAAAGLVSRFRNLLHHHVHASSPGAAETFWAGLGAVRRETFEAVGGFDAGRFRRASVEDIDLGVRLRRRGARLLLDPEIRGRHLKAWTPLSMVRTDFGRRGVPWVRLLLRERRGSAALNLGWRHRLSALAAVAFLAAALARRPRAALAALAAALTLDRPLYVLLARRGGLRLLAAGIPLHLLHRLTAVAAVPSGIAAHAFERWRLHLGMRDKSAREERSG